MSPSVGKKLSFWIATAVALTAAGIGYVSYRTIDRRLGEVVRKDTLDTATLLASRVRNELRHFAEKGRILTAAALEEFKNPEDQMRFLEDNLTFDDQFIAMTLYRRSAASNGKWTSVFRLTRPEHDPASLKDEDFRQLDLKYPLDFGLVGTGGIEVAMGALADGTPILRMAVPIVRKGAGHFTQLVGIEVRQERLTAAFAEAANHFSFVMDRTGRVIAQTDPTHFTLGEDLSHLPILMMSRATEAPNGNLDYYEVPGASMQYGSFHKVGFADLTVVTQAPRTAVLAVLRDYVREAGFIGIACAMAAAALSLLAVWGVVGLRLSRIGRTLETVGEGNFAARFPEVHGEDEIGDFARTLQKVTDQLAHRDQTHGTYAKIRSRRARALLNDGKLAVRGEKSKGFVLHCQLHGLDALATTAEPEAVLELLNDFFTKASQVIQTHGGIVDHVHGGAIVAFWGLPAAGSDDADRVLHVSLQLRELGRELCNTLSRRHFPAVRVSMGLAHGHLTAGEIGAADRREYSPIGEAVDIAARIQNFTEQFGTDFLMTGDTARTAPEWYSVEQVSSGDDSAPELWELVATARQGTLEPVDEIEDAPAESVSPENAEPAAEVPAESPAAAPAEAPVPIAKKKRKRARDFAEDAAEPALSSNESGSGPNAVSDEPSVSSSAESSDEAA